MTNPLIEQVRKPLTERGWHQSEESFNEGDYLNATLGDVESLFEARCIQALEDQPALIAEVERLELRIKDANRVMLEIDAAIIHGRLDARSAIGDARLDYGQPNSAKEISMAERCVVLEEALRGIQHIADDMDCHNQYYDISGDPPEGPNYCGDIDDCNKHSILQHVRAAITPTNTKDND